MCKKVEEKFVNITNFERSTTTTKTSFENEEQQIAKRVNKS